MDYMGVMYTLKKVQYAPSESRETAHIAGFCWPKSGGFLANQAGNNTQSISYVPISAILSA